MQEKRKKEELTQTKVQELFDLDWEAGKLTRKTINNSRHRVGEIAGYLNKTTGYWGIKISGKSYKVHRIIWLHIHGYFPEHGIDHIDRDKSNNRPSNLREVPQSCNVKNAGARRDNTSGIKGVGQNTTHNKWLAQIQNSKKKVHIYYGEDLTEAVAHRLAAEQALDWSGCDSCSPAFLYMQAFVNGEDMNLYLNGGAN